MTAPADSPPAACVTLYTTFNDSSEAERIIDALLEKRLIACANMLPSMTSYYRWQGKREQSQEVAVLMKTTAAQEEQAIACIREMHFYDCPCITAWPISGGLPEYLHWINDETGLP